GDLVVCRRLLGAVRTGAGRSGGARGAACRALKGFRQGGEEIAVELRPALMPPALVLLAVAFGGMAQSPPGKPTPNKPDEPRAKALSLERSAEFLDGVTLAWLKQRKCASCHTGFPYLMARQALGDAKAPALLEVRRFFEDRVAAWDKGGKGAGYLKGQGALK